MSSEKMPDAGYEELQRKKAAAEALHTLGRKIIGTFKEIPSEEYDIGALHIGVHRCDPLEHDIHEYPMYWFEIKDRSVDPPFSIDVSVTLDRGTPFIQHLFVQAKESPLRMHLSVIEGVVLQLAQHVESLKPIVNTALIQEQIRKVVGQE